MSYGAAVVVDDVEDEEELPSVDDVDDVDDDVDEDVVDGRVEDVGGTVVVVVRPRVVVVDEGGADVVVALAGTTYTGTYIGRTST
jgi:glutamate/tyrosine decarboxylase-like PLP-dependent enzyme